MIDFEILKTTTTALPPLKKNSIKISVNLNQKQKHLKHKQKSVNNSIVKQKLKS